MRRLLVCNIMSLDGYYTGPGNNIMVLPMDGAFDSYNLERMRAADTVLLGHNSFQMFSGFWPAMAVRTAQVTDHSEHRRDLRTPR